jgi:hypothetical protein
VAAEEARVDGEVLASEADNRLVEALSDINASNPFPISTAAI